ncbi:FkbM family methyltransferase [Temperatibacter marinus]|uniref:FkbM family methyltransferase n=1 Tax=Temperatibacter marinus TaxID=1456591 RepID=A0AA52EG47_9PROT|nr:FkbM family methyltransferase [Temperatibacter marinus]WND02185.1 FkbM family methyltransferase [Temperatibacter marinus]
MTSIMKYIKAFFRIHYELMRAPLNALERSRFNRVGLLIRNLKSLLKGKYHRFGYASELECFYIEEKGERYYFSNLVRGINLYSEGLSVRRDEIVSSYFIDQIDFAPGDIVIDCGANYGDLWLYLKTQINENTYIPFEPGIEEYKALSLNAPKSLKNNLGLGYENNKKKFFVNNKDADSSFIQPSEYSDIIYVETMRLDDFVKQNNIGEIKLFKCEAEGFEPEVFNGVGSILDQIHYIAVDGGYERGFKKEETFSHQTNLLIAQGFSMVAINFQLGRALFRNKKYI